MISVRSGGTTRRSLDNGELHYVESANLMERA
jgi:hypothetical protein